MAKYKKKPVVIEAVQLRWDTWNEMCDFANVGRLKDGKPEGVEGLPNNAIGLDIPTVEKSVKGLLKVKENDWVLKDINGVLHPCKPGIFDKIYELVID